MTEKPPVAKVICREIREDDFAGITDLMARGFKAFSRQHWEKVFHRMSDRPAPLDYPRFGWLLESEGKIVGSIFTIYSDKLEDGVREVRCSTSSWFVEPQFRGHGMRLARQAVKHSEVIYINPTPGAGTFRVLEHLGYLPYCRGHYLAFAALSFSSNRARVRSVEKAGPKLSKLSPYEADLLLSHAAYGCISVVCETTDDVLPFVFLPRSSPWHLPYAQLIYCRRASDVIRLAGALGRYLAVRGCPVIAIDSNGPIRGLAGRYMDSKPKFYKGLAPPRLGDLAYTELPFFA
jgi:hypothetical protein